MILACYLTKVMAEKSDVKKKIRRSEDKESRGLKDIIANLTGYYASSIKNTKGWDYT